MLRLVVSLIILSCSFAHAEEPILISCSGPGDRTCPLHCQRDLSHHYGIIRYTKLPRGYLGHYTGPSVNVAFAEPTITLNMDIPARYLEAAKHHEACHRETEILTGNWQYED